MAKYVDEGNLARFWDNIQDQIGNASQEQVDAWLDAHPEATTTVQDGSITTAKLADGAVTDDKLAQTGGVLEEVHDIRTGADGKTYASAGEAVRNLSIAASVANTRLSNLDGYLVPDMELGYIAFASTSIDFQNRNTSVRTPQGEGIPVKVGDVVSLTDYTAAKFKYAIEMSAGSYSYDNTYRTSDLTIQFEGTLYLVVNKSDDSAIESPAAISSLVRVRRFDGRVDVVESNVAYLNNYQNILETGHFITLPFANGDVSNGIFYPNLRPYRVSTTKPLTFAYDVYLTAADGYRFYLYVWDDSTGTWNGLGWKTSADIGASTSFLMVIAKVTETPAVIPEVSDFVSTINVKTNLTEEAESEISVDEDAIAEYMSHFYSSNLAESYAFFTDPHLMGANGTFSESTFTHYISVLDETIKRASVPYVVCGGDWLNNGDTKAQASKKLGYVDGKMRSLFPCRFMPIVGNHDFNYLGVDSQGVRLTEQNWVSNAAMRNFWFHDHDECYYKFKLDVAQNYVLNTRTDYDGTGAYDEEQLDWLADSLVSDDPDHATIMLHIFYLSSVGTTITTRVKAVGEIISAFNSHTTCVLTEAEHEYDKTYDFSGTSGHIDYVLAGHSHADFTDTLGGVPVVGCINFTSGDVASFDLVFADYDSGILYLTRIGTGESRTVRI